jgi:uncharacterized membrane protein YgcG
VQRRLRVFGLAVFALCLLGAPASAADEGWIVQRFASDVTIQTDGSLRIVETIDVDFRGLQKHGIFRTIPYRYQWDETHVRVYRLAVRSVSDDQGRAVRYDVSAGGPNTVIKIGDPNVTVTGLRTYKITYDVGGAMNAFADRDELFWNVNGGNWPVPMTAVTATVHVPSGLQKITCYQGPRGSTALCGATMEPNRADFATTLPLLIGEQLTIVAALAKGVVTEPAPILEESGKTLPQHFEPQPENAAPSIGAAVSVFFAGLAALFWRWYTAGRDERERETIVPEYEPPDKLRPAQLGLILDESADKKDVTATIVDLAVRGYLTITEKKSRLFGGKDWTLRSTGKAPNDLQVYERVIWNGLFKGREEVKVSELREHFVVSLRAAQESLYADSAKRKWFPTRPDEVRRGYMGLAALAIFAGVGIAWLLGTTLGAGLIGMAVAALGVVALPVSQVMPAKTAAGAELLRRTLGFRQYMEVAEKERQRFAERENIFSEYLPYAIVFGCVEKWARAFKDIDVEAQTASWYAGTGQFNANALSSSLQGFSSNLGSAIAATPGSKGGSGFSGGGGGGGAGGGGGGGGGGSW